MSKKNSVLVYSLEFLSVFTIILAAYMLWSFSQHQEEKTDIYSSVCSSKILKAAIIDYDVTKGYPGPPPDYFMDIADFLATRLDVKLEIIHCKNFAEAQELILEKKAHVFLITNPFDMYRPSKLKFSKPYITANWHLIVNRDDIKINTPDDLQDQTIVVSANNPAISVLQQLEQKNKNFKLVVNKDLSVKEIFSKIENGEITASAADNLTARAMRYFHPKTIVAGKIKAQTELGFAFHPKAHEMMFRVNEFIDNICDEDFIKILAAHHFHKLDVFEYLDIRKFHRRLKTRLPKYIKTIKKYSAKNNLDWRLVAAQIYQESHFNRWARSSARAKGLMQLLPSTANSLGVSDIYSPEQNIKAGIEYLRKLYDIFDKAPPTDRMKIALSTYNIGQGHMYDVRKIARDLNIDPNKWYNVMRILPLLKKKKYYSDLKYGYAKGDEPVNYVKKIYGFYKILKVLYPKDPSIANTEGSLSTDITEKKD